MEDLPDLLTGRWNHGCGHYVNNDDKMVTLVTLLDDIYVTYEPISGVPSYRGLDRLCRTGINRNSQFRIRCLETGW